MRREHELKTWPEPFEAIAARRKRHEIRTNDRDYREGDTLWLREWNPGGGRYTGRDMRVLVTYLTPGGAWGLPANKCVMSIALLGASNPIEIESKCRHCNGTKWLQGEIEDGITTIVSCPFCSPTRSAERESRLTESAGMLERTSLLDHSMRVSCRYGNWAGTLGEAVYDRRDNTYRCPVCCSHIEIPREASGTAPPSQLKPQEGWVLVPVKLTGEMRSAASRSIRMDADLVDFVWDAALAARPKGGAG